MRLIFTLFIAFCFCAFQGHTQALTALTLNGTNSFVQVPNPLNFGTDQDFSIELKVKTTGWSGDPAIFSDKNWDAGANAGMVISANTNGNSWKFNIGNGAGNRIDLNSGGKINDGLWHHLTVTFDRDGAKRIYQDGRLLQTSNATITGNINGLANLCFGQDGTAAYDYFFPGAIADVRVWQVALDSATVAQWVCQPINNQHPNFAQLLHHWTFTEGAGTSVADNTGTANGAIVGDAVWGMENVPAAAAAFSFLVTDLNVDFINNTTDATTYAWDFGDGSTSTLATPSHLYTTPGAYTVTLVAKGLCSADSLSKTVVVAAAGGPTPVPGAGRALDFDGDNDYVIVANQPALKMTDALTLEAWIKPRSFAQWESVLSFAQDNGCSESGYDFSWVDGQLRFRCNTVNMACNEWNGNPGAAITTLNEWMHVSGVYDGVQMKMYVNGVLADVQNKTGAIDWEFDPTDLRIGAFHDDNENYYFDGQIDEVRIWKVARTEAEIRETMCQKLNGAENGLVGYWRLDEAGGNTAKNLNDDTLDGTLTNMSAVSDRVVSGAAVGDGAAHIYTEDWTQPTAGLAVLLENLGIFGINEIEGEPEGIHLYVIDSLVPTPTSIFPGYTLFDRGAQIGVFPTKSTASYQFGWDYAQNNEAVAAVPNIAILQRNEPGVSDWTDIGAVVNTVGNFTDARRIYSHRQFVPTKNFGTNCLWNGYEVNAVQASFNAITLAWDIPGVVSAIEYGPVGYSFANGNTLNQIMADSITVDSLEAQSLYDFYLYLDCGANHVPGWYGPYTFGTLSCLAPSELATLNVGTNDAQINWNAVPGLQYDMQWGPTGFQLGIGIQVANVTAPHTLNGLSANKTYDVYLKTDCGSAGESAWVGPLTFTTGTSATTTLADEMVQVFPNPNTGNCWVDMQDGLAIGWKIVDLAGKLLQSGTAIGDFKLSNLPQGFHTLVIENGQIVVKKPLVILR